MKIKHLLLSIILCLPVIALFAQNNILKGKIFYFSSGNKPAKGVEIQGKTQSLKWSNAVRSTDDGDFEIEFLEEAVGQKIELRIGTKDRYSQTLEIVNQKVINEFRLAKNANAQFEVIVCKKGKRDEAAQRYYKILKTGADKKLAQAQEQLDKLLAEKEKQKKDIRALFTHIDKLEERARDSIALYKAAYKIASINTDKATERVKKYLDLLDQGKSIEEALKVLDIKIATQEARSGIKDFDNAIQEIETKVEGLVALFQYSQAISLYDTIITLLIEADKNLLTIANYRLLAAIQLDKNGQYDLALQQGLKVVTIREKNLDSTDQDLITSYNNIAETYRYLGEYNKALDYHLKAIKIHQVVLEPNRPNLATSYNNIGLTYYYLQEYNKALDYNLKAIKIRQVVLEPNHLDLANSYNNIAGIYESLGEYNKALKLYLKAKRILEVVLKPNHPDLAVFYNNIGTTYESLGEYSKALGFDLKAINIREVILKPNHPDLANSYNNIAGTYESLGKYSKALEFYFKAKKILEAVLESNHPKLASFYNNIAGTYESLRKYSKALDFHLKAINIREAILKPNHPDLATSYNNIAETYQSLGEYNKALTFHSKAINILESILEPNYFSLAAFYNNIAVNYQYLGEYNKALNFHFKAIKIRQVLKNHPDLATSYNNIASTYSFLNQYDEAVSFQIEAIRILAKVLPENHPNLLTSFDNFMDIYTEKATQLFSQKLYQSALQDFNFIHQYYPSGENWNSIGLCYYYLKDYPKSIEAYQQSIELDTTLLPQGYYNNIGMGYTKNKQFKKAKTAFEAYQKIYPKLGRTYRNWAMYHALQGETDKALDFLQQAIDLGYQDLDFLKADDSMDSLRKKRRFKKILKTVEKRQANDKK